MADKLDCGITRILSSREISLAAAIVGADWGMNGKRSWDLKLFEGIDWTRIPHLAWNLKIRPMMAAALREAGWPSVPIEVRTEIEKSERACAIKNAAQLELLAQITSAAEKERLRFLSVKGVALGLFLYHNPFIRESYDLDVLVHPQEMEPFGRMLERIGFEKEVKAKLTDRQEKFLRLYRQHDKYLSPAAHVHLDCHFSLEINPYLYRTDFNALWQEHVHVTGLGAQIPIPGPADLFYYLGIHATRHGWERWKWLSDLLALRRAGDNSYLKAVRAKAAREGNEKLFDSWLLLMDWIAGIPVPRELASQTSQSKEVCRQASRALSMSIVPPAFLPTVDTKRYYAYGTRRLVYSLRLKRNFAYWICIMLRLCVREDDWRATHLPDAMMPLLFLARPILLLGRLIRRVAGRIVPTRNEPALALSGSVETFPEARKL